MKIEIKSWLISGVVFSLETDSLKLCVEAAVESRANLRGADLRDADLRGANLRDAKNITHFPCYIFGHKHFIQTTNDGKLQIGCETRTFDEWTEGAQALGESNNYSAFDIEIYKLHIEHIARVSKLLWSKAAEKGLA